MTSETPTLVDASKIAISEKTTNESKPYVGKWNTLISTTNWDKGLIICQWRKQLEDEDVKPSEFSDEAWSQLVGGVTPQHVGRLRRCYDRFGHVYASYENIFWSHFYAALDWDDAEMWLEGAVQSKWSVSAMRKQRWETLGKVGEAPSPDVVATEINEETQSLSLSERPRNNDADYVEGPVHEGPDWGDERNQPPNSSKSSSDASSDASADPQSDETAVAKPHAIRPFESFDGLPDDVMDAANSFKVAIIRHKAAQWDECSQEDLLGMLDALKQLTTIASE